MLGGVVLARTWRPTFQPWLIALNISELSEYHQQSLSGRKAGKEQRGLSRTSSTPAGAALLTWWLSALQRCN